MWFRDLQQLLRVNRERWNAGGLLLLPVLIFAPAAVAQSIEPVGKIEQADLSELSGLAVSHRVPGRWWGLNDSGHPPELFVLDATGAHLGQVAVKASNVDWEDLTSYQEKGESFIAIADTGDNFSLRREASILILREPAAALPAALPLERTIRFSFADGPRDCEALAADPARGRFLLIDKNRHPAGLYELPMHPGPGIAVARRIADLPSLWRQESDPAVSLKGSDRTRGSATAMDLSPDGRRLLVLTYRHLVLFERAADEDWPQALARGPRMLPFKLWLAEAMGWNADGSGALIGAEREHSQLLRWDGVMP